MLKWFPKYIVPLSLTKAVISSTEANEQLETILIKFGFTFQHATKTQICFSRGKSWGDFSINLIRIYLIFDTPLSEITMMKVEIADMCFVDTGDLLTLSTELSNYFSEQFKLDSLKAS